MKQYATPKLAPKAVIGVIGNAKAQNVKDEINKIVSLASPLKIVQSSTKQLNTAADIPAVIQEVTAKGAQALYVCTDPLITANAPTINQLAGMPTMHAFSKNAGGINSGLYLGYELTDLFSQIADIIYNWRTTPVAAFPNPTTPSYPIHHHP